MHLRPHFPTDYERPQPQFGLFLIPGRSSLAAKLDTTRGLAPNFEPAICLQGPTRMGSVSHHRQGITHRRRGYIARHNPHSSGVRGRNTRSSLAAGAGLSGTDPGNRQLAIIPTSHIKPTTHIAPNHSRSSTLSTPGDASADTTPTARILGNPLLVHVNRSLRQLPPALNYPPRTGAIPILRPSWNAAQSGKYRPLLLQLSQVFA